MTKSLVYKPFALFLLFLGLAGGCYQSGGTAAQDGGGDGDGDTDSDTDTDADGDSDGDADSDSDTDGDGDGDTDTDGDTDSDTDTDADGDSDGDADSDSDTDGDGDGDTDTDGDADSDSDTDADGDSDSDTGPPDGLGDDCQDDDDCAPLTAEYCAINPLTGMGYCTVLACDSTVDCYTGWECCDCALSPILPPVVACLTEEDAALAGSLAGCFCGNLEIPEGMGEPCVKSNQCADFEADLCMFNTEKNTGYCTTADCGIDDCPYGYTCCDCSDAKIVPSKQLCATENDAMALDHLGICKCDV